MRFFDPLQTHEVSRHTLRSRVKVCGRNFALTSLENAEVTGKPHNDVLKAIRKMEPAWLKVNGSNFRLVDYKDSKGELRPCYSLTKTECLYIATKFNDEARSKLVIRWQQLEQERLMRNNGDWYLFHSIKGWGGLIHF